MLVDKNDIRTLIPQRDPFVLIDALIDCSDNGATSAFEVKRDHLLTENDWLSEAGLIEHIAQTGAARIGYICRQENKPVPVGFIGAVQRWNLQRLPKTGETLHTDIQIKNQVFNATIMVGTVKVNDSVVASCEMKIFISSTP